MQSVEQSPLMSVWDNKAWNWMSLVYRTFYQPVEQGLYLSSYVIFRHHATPLAYPELKLR
jgi:hypothetical protein